MLFGVYWASVFHGTIEYKIACRGEIMANQTVSNDDSHQIIDIERKDGLLEELNVPPRAIKFIRENSNNLQIAAIVLVVLIFAWTYYDYYSSNRQSESAYALHTAMQELDEARQDELLQQIISEKSGTDAAFWARLELGHKAARTEKYDDALAIYMGLAKEVSAANPLSPLLNRSMALTYESKGDLDQALVYYQKLSLSNGFETEGLMALGRIYEQKSMVPEALDSYRQAIENSQLTAPKKGVLTEKINTLQGSVSAS